MSKRDPNYIDRHVGNRVRMRRLLIGMSQEKLGELLGITFQQVQKYEKGSNRVSASRLYYLAQILGVPVQFFFDELPETGNQPGMSEVGMTDLLSSSEVSQLARAFSEISDPVARRAIMGMVKQFADSKSD
jgi:transcriptional regulator with XRE-family HTH domain